jgi:hypothetical protein
VSSGSAARTAPAGVTAASRAVLRGLAAYRQRNPDAPLVAVGDMGLRHGGEIDRHATHENGRQIGSRVRMVTSARVIRWPNHDDHLHSMF